MDKLKIFIMIGLPGSGKSFESIKLINENTIIINRDKIREMLAGDYGKYNFNTMEKLTNAIKKESIRLSIEKNYNIIIDETHLTVKSRLKELVIIDLIPTKTHFEIIYVWCTEEKNNLKYRMESPKNTSEKTWKGVIADMKKHYQYPNSDLEHWDKLIKIRRN